VHKFLNPPSCRSNAGGSYIIQYVPFIVSQNRAALWYTKLAFHVSCHNMNAPTEAVLLLTQF